MATKNIFENENVKLRIINLEYSYKNRFASNNPNEVKKAKDLLDAAGAKIIGAILNKASLDNTSDYYYYYGKDKQ